MQPEKLVIFGPMIIFFLFFGALVIGFLIVVAKVISRGRKSAWKGVVVDKLFNEQRGSFEDSHKIDQFYTLVFKIEDGSQKKIAVSKTMYDDYKIGDRAEKKSGDFWQKKVI
ncbi:MAG: hypothetical protein NTY75_01840 [Candidatus Shapirobacteria bacterium]|nr:hypothetical protein [Candidatus Shapirobacteria bacterium]